MTAPIISRASDRKRSRPRWNRCQKTLWASAICSLFLVIIILSSWLIGDAGLSPALTERNEPPSLAHPFGTDWLGRDMLTRSLHGMSVSVRVGLPVYIPML